MQSYYWVKIFYIVFVVVWMVMVFYLLCILVNLVEIVGQLVVIECLQLMGLCLYCFGYLMFGLVFVLGLVLWLGYKIILDFLIMVVLGGVGWLYVKLGLVVVLLVYFSWIGCLLKGVVKGRVLLLLCVLWWINEILLLVFILIVWLVLVKLF